MNGAENVFEVIQKYFDNSVVLVLALLCAIYCLRKAPKETRLFVVVLMLTLILVFNEGSYFIIKKIGETETYYRFIWMMPVLLLAAHLLILLYEDLEARWKKAIFCVIVIIGLFSFGSEKLVRFTKMPENIYQIPQRIIDICNVIDKERMPGESVIVLSEEEILYGVREYNAYIMEPYQGGIDYLQLLMERNDSNINGHTAAAIINMAQIEYIVLEKQDTCFWAAMLSVGCVPIGETEEYVILNACLDDAEEYCELFMANELPSEIPIWNYESVYVGLDEKMEFVYYPDNHLSYLETETGERIHIFTEEAEFQQVEFEEFILCAVDTDNQQIEDTTIQAMQKIMQGEKKVIVFVTTPIYQESVPFYEPEEMFGGELAGANENALTLIEILTASDNNIAAVLTNSSVGFSKRMLNETVLQYICETDGTHGTMLYIK